LEALAALLSSRPLLEQVLRYSDQRIRRDGLSGALYFIGREGQDASSARSDPLLGTPGPLAAS
jgi:hypothetical protein